MFKQEILQKIRKNGVIVQAAYTCTMYSQTVFLDYMDTLAKIKSSTG